VQIRLHSSGPEQDAHPSTITRSALLMEGDE